MVGAALWGAFALGRKVAPPGVDLWPLLVVGAGFVLALGLPLGDVFPARSKDDEDDAAAYRRAALGVGVMLLGTALLARSLGLLPSVDVDVGRAAPFLMAAAVAAFSFRRARPSAR